ncbi:wax ester synthase/diacylglycerol acyltransferase 11-like [Primulina eburnea]|uniref:wax ester synthase/diacylglycerol acyltransferase 11-like n=1 Tax=Primulina eburnea TaxID=1245227 RepID=UPI003C6BE050
MEIPFDEPVSPTGQYFTSSVISVSVIGVMESEIPIDDSQTMELLRDLFLPVNPRFSSVMVKDQKGVKHWKRVEVKFQDHLNTPIFEEGKSPEYYQQCLTQYLSKIAMEPFPQTRPLWEIHIFKYPTIHGCGNLIFKLHHSLGDGFSLMGALLSCLQRADDPSIPLTFPILNRNTEVKKREGFLRKLSTICCGTINTLSDFGWSLLKSTFVKDCKSPIRSGEDGVEFRPITITTLSFSLHQIKQIKSNIHVTLNDVICGVMFMGIRLYMQEMSHDSRNADSTALVLLNTRNIAGYKSIPEMIEPDAESPWGNQFAFLHVSVPVLTEEELSNPLSIVFKARAAINRKRNSSAVLLTGKLLDTMRKFRGPEATASYIHSTLKNTSMTISNVVGPVEQMALANQPVKGIYFMVAGVPQSLTITMVSYMGTLRIAVGTEDGHIQSHEFKSCVQKAFDIIFKAAVPSDPLKTV